MLPRRHILDIWESTESDEERLAMTAGTLAIDAVKYLELNHARDHLVEALDLNEFICYMHPSMRPGNRCLLFHVVSDLLGLLLYGMPKKRRGSVESLEVIDYSSRSTSFPVIEVWRYLKTQVGTRRATDTTIVEGFIRKIGVEMSIVDHYPFIDDLFAASLREVEQWLPALSGFFEKSPSEIMNIYDQWCSIWLCRGDREALLNSMVERLCLQAQRDFGIAIDRESVVSRILDEGDENKRGCETFSRWYREGVDLLFSI